MKLVLFVSRQTGRKTLFVYLFRIPRFGGSRRIDEEGTQKAFFCYQKGVRI